MNELGDDDRFVDRCVLVTGAGGGIGGATAAAFAARGALVVAADVALADPPDDSHGAAIDPASSDFGALLAARMRRGDITAVRLDVRSRATLETLATACEDNGHGIDILVNAAGIVSFGTASTLEEAEWDRVLDINLKGSFFAARAVMPAMKRRRFGRIVNLGSVVGKNGGNARPWLDANELDRAGNVAYGISKAGVHAMTAFLAKELAAHGITVNAVAPGPIATAMTTGLPDSLRTLIPVGRMGSLDDVVRAILFVADPAAGFITGSIVDVNGGIDCR